MAPSIAQFPNKEFYKGTLKNHPDTLTDNAIRKWYREVVLDIYKKRMPEKDGEGQYLMANVKNAISMVKEGGHSPQ
jgi:superfamily I DNA and/or RNA helicase